MRDPPECIPAVLFWGDLDPGLFGDGELMESDVAFLAASGVTADGFTQVEDSTLIVQRTRLRGLVQ